MLAAARSATLPDEDEDDPFGLLNAPTPATPAPVHVEDDLELEGWGSSEPEPESAGWVATPTASTEVVRSYLDHLIETLGHPTQTWEDVDLEQPVRVHLFGPRVGRDWAVFATDGMRRWAMPVPDPKRFPARLELTLHAVDEIPETDTVPWQVPLLVRLARSPRALDSWTWPGDLYGPLRRGLPKPWRDLVLWPITQLSAGFELAATPEGPTRLLAVWPVRDDEARLADREGTDVLLQALERAQVDERFDPERPSVLPSAR